MTQVQNLNIRASVKIVDIIDSIIEDHSEKGCWPNSSYSLRDIQPAIDDHLLVICADGTIAPLVRGVILSSWWPAIEPLISLYWDCLCRAANTGDRSVEPTYCFQDSEKEFLVNIALDVIARHLWYGHRFSVQQNRKLIITSLPHYIERCLSVRGFSNIFKKVPEIWRVYERQSRDIGEHKRTHRSIRELEMRCFHDIVGQELITTVIAPANAPQWLRRIVEEYVDEADSALAGGAAFAAAVIYVAALEAVLTARYADPPLPQSFNKGVDGDVFTIRDLMKIGEQDIKQHGNLWKRIMFARRIRNSVHGNRFAESSSMIGIIDSLEVRKTLRDTIIFASGHR